MNDLAELIGHMPDAPMLEKVLRLEEAIKQGPTQELRYEMHYAPGICARVLFIPAGTTLTGKIHKHATLNILASGDISVTTDEGVKRMQAPNIFTAPAGTKRAGFAHADTVWINIHANPDNERDEDKIEAQHIAPSIAAYLEFSGALKQIGAK